VDVADLESTGQRLRNVSTSSGSFADVYYDRWKLKVATNAKLVAAQKAIFRATYAADASERGPLWRHGYGDNIDVDKEMYAYVDRAGFRLPDALGDGRFKQLGIKTHVDCCPRSVLGDGASGEAVKRWRPIQCLVALSDTASADCGGFSCAPGFHKSFATHFSLKADQPPVDATGRRTASGAVCHGAFLPLAHDTEVDAAVVHVPIPAGSAVFWDQRLPHRQEQRHNGVEPRSVVYVGFLPPCALNRSYAKMQAKTLQLGVPPPDFLPMNVDSKELDEFAKRLSARGIDNFWDALVRTQSKEQGKKDAEYSLTARERSLLGCAL